MPSQPIQVSIEKGLLKRIDTDPETKKRGRSAFIHSAVELYLRAKERRAVDHAIRQAYAGKRDEMLAEIEELIEVQEWPERQFTRSQRPDAQTRRAGISRI